MVERNHRTIKRMVARTGHSVNKMVFFYNNSPKHGLDDNSVPSRRLYKYCSDVNQLFGKVDRELKDVGNPYKIAWRSCFCEAASSYLHATLEGG